MAIPDQPLVVQVNWNDTEGPSAWNQTHANILVGQVQSLQVQHNAFHKDVRAEVCTIEATDLDYQLRPLKESSALWPNVRLHRRIRALRRTPLGGFQCVFFGYLSNIQNDPKAINPPTVTLTAESALAVLARRKVTMPTEVNAAVWRSLPDSRTTGTGILNDLMQQLSFTGTPFIDFDDVGHQKIEGTWGGGVLTVAEVLAACCGATGCVMSCEAYVQELEGDPNFVLHWRRPLGGGTPAVSWDSRDGTLEASSTLTIDYNDTRAA